MFARSDVSLPFPDPRITEAAFIGTSWGGTGISLCFLLFRLFVRLNAFQRLYSDDFIIIAAWAMKLATAIIWQINVPVLYEYLAAIAGKKPFDVGFLDRAIAILRTGVLLNILFYTALWLVKLSFLMFFRRLGSKVKGQKIWWWCILVFTVLTWVACIADFQYKCSLNSLAFIVSYCGSRDSISYQHHTFYANCVADVITDCLIISIPVLMLWHVRIALRQKLILIGIFSVTVVVVIVAIIRVTTIDPEQGYIDISWLYVWSSVEVSTSIIIACISSFRQLFVTDQNQHQYRTPGQSSPIATHRGLLHSFRSLRGKCPSIVSGSNREPATISSNRNQSSWHRLNSKIQIVPLDGIHISQDNSISSRTLKHMRRLSGGYP